MRYHCISILFRLVKIFKMVNYSPKSVIARFDTSNPLSTISSFLGKCKGHAWFLYHWALGVLKSVGLAQLGSVSPFCKRVIPKARLAFKLSRAKSMLFYFIRRGRKLTRELKQLMGLRLGHEKACLLPVLTNMSRAYDPYWRMRTVRAGISPRVFWTPPIESMPKRKVGALTQSYGLNMTGSYKVRLNSWRLNLFVVLFFIFLPHHIT